MKVTQDVRDYAASLGGNEKAALGLDASTAEAGMKEMSEKFKALGNDVYVDAEKVKASNKAL
jgi:phosphomethylpyrimidine synthase